MLRTSFKKENTTLKEQIALRDKLIALLKENSSDEVERSRLIKDVLDLTNFTSPKLDGVRVQ